MPWAKGQSGNPRGRPKCGYSLAELTRARCRPAVIRKILDRMIALATQPETPSDVRIRAFEALRRAGWPDEARGQFTLEPPNGGSVKLVYEYRD